ncbi:hypothetical protein F5Y09DRAFT_302227 [Xylaria sp. FL1042]|nr:hypothetical protein F5Y09DRAFT_302227 [Xylaria sp. FL1042]
MLDSDINRFIVGWYGLSKDTIDHQKTVAVEPPQTTPTVVDYHESFSPTETFMQDQLPILAHKGIYPFPPPFPVHEERLHMFVANTLEDIAKDPTIPTGHLSATHSNPATFIGEAHEATVFMTVVVTVTSLITDTALKTSTTAVFVSTCTTCVTTATTPTTHASVTTTTNSQNPTTASVMTGLMYCSFTGRKNIYTPCPLVHTDSPGMLTGVPTAISSGAPRMKNSLTAARFAIVSLWNAIPGLGRVMHAEDHGNRGCDCSRMKRKLEAAVDLIRMQQRLLESQRDVIREHRRGLHVVLETLANLTATRVGERTARDAPLDLNI